MLWGPVPAGFWGIGRHGCAERGFGAILLARRREPPVAVSSRGLGRGPLKAETRVRIPLPLCFLVRPRAQHSSSSPHRLVARTPLFQGGNRGSIPLGGVAVRLPGEGCSESFQGRVAAAADRQPSSAYGFPYEDHPSDRRQHICPAQGRGGPGERLDRAAPGRRPARVPETERGRSPRRSPLSKRRRPSLREIASSSLRSGLASEKMSSRVPVCHIRAPRAGISSTPKDEQQQPDRNRVGCSQPCQEGVPWEPPRRHCAQVVPQGVACGERERFERKKGDGVRPDRARMANGARGAPRPWRHWRRRRRLLAMPARGE